MGAMDEAYEQHPDAHRQRGGGSRERELQKRIDALEARLKTVEAGGHLKAGNCIRLDGNQISFNGTVHFQCNDDGTATITLK